MGAGEAVASAVAAPEAVGGAEGALLRVAASCGEGVSERVGRAVSEARALPLGGAEAGADTVMGGETLALALGAPEAAADPEGGGVAGAVAKPEGEAVAAPEAESAAGEPVGAEEGGAEPEARALGVVEEEALGVAELRAEALGLGAGGGVPSLDGDAEGGAD